MQQPRQMYGLGSFVKKAVRKVTKPFTKVAKKIVPKEVAGIMRTAAPFLPPGYREAAYLLGTAKQTGRISPIDLALTAAPTFFSKTDLGKGIAQSVGDFTLPGMDTNLRDLTLGKEAFAGTDVPLVSRPGGALTGKTATLGATPETSGIFGKGGKFFQFGVKDSPKILDTKAGQFLLGDDEGGFSKAKLAGVGVGVLSLVQNAKTADEAGQALAQSTGQPSDYERGFQLFSQLKPELFQVPEEFRMNVKDGGRIGFQRGTGPRNLTRENKTDFFKDLFLERQGGGGRDFMIPERAADFKKYYRETEEFPGIKVLDAPEGVNIFTSAEQAKKMNLDIAKELEAERIFPVLYDKTMEILDVVLDMPDSEEKTKILYDINHGIRDKQTDSGMSAVANANYEIIQKYGYLLDKPEGLGSLKPRKPISDAKDGGIMRTNYARGSDDDKPVLPEDPTKPINPFGPKPIKPLGDMKMAEFDLKDYMEEFERVFPEMIEKRGTQEYMDMLEDYFRGLASKNREGIMMAGGFNDKYMSPEYAEEFKKFMMKEQEQNKELMLDDLMERFKQNMRKKDPILEAKDGGRANLALGTKPTAEESGLGGLPIEADMRYTGGFMPYGAKEKADDVPARLSKNEFVFTADAVRAAGGGSVNEGAKKMYATMKQLEAKPEAKGMTA